ncbi:MAG: carbohydrate ABC transporter permease, partial [Promicromonosporaceae bacterium]|nr:carbohydrate ABC transporter permease [Promicromonosporaceae bacterium]
MTSVPVSAAVLDTLDPLHRVEHQALRGDSSGIRGRKEITASILKHTLLLVITIGMVYPLLWMLSRSFMPNELIFRDVNLIPDPFTWDNYTSGWNALAFPFSHYIRNSLIIVIGQILGQLISCSITAYAFARMRFRLRQPMFAIMLLTVMLPSQLTLIPQYIMWHRMGMLNTFVPLIAPAFFATHAFFVFLMVQFTRGIPKELDESARIDGAVHVRVFAQIVLPLMKPALATVTI